MSFEEGQDMKYILKRQKAKGKLFRGSFYKEEEVGTNP